MLMTQASHDFYSKMMRYRAFCPNYNLEENEDYEVVIIFMMLKLVQSLYSVMEAYILDQTILKLEDLKVLKRSPDLLNNVKKGHGQLRLIIQTYFVLPYMGNGHLDQVTQK